MKIKVLIALLFVSLLGISACSSNKTNTLMAEPGTASQYGELRNAFIDKEFQIHMDSDQQQYALPVTDIKIVLENTGSKRIGHSEYLFLEKREGGTWHSIPYQEPFAFADIGLELEPGKAVEQEVPFDYLDFEWTAGTYRIVKPIYVGEDSKEILLAAQFRISE